MIFIILPVVIGALGAGLAAWAANEARREEEEKRREEAGRKAQQEAREREDRDSQASAAAKFIGNHGVRITPKRLVDLGINGATGVIRVMKRESQWTRELQRRSEQIRRLEGEEKEVAALMAVIERGGDR